MVGRGDVWLSALVVAAMVHLDWHLGRPGHGMSFGLGYHWLTAVPTALLLARVARVRWPATPSRGVAVVTVLGLALGQGLEPLAEIVLFPAGGMAPVTNPLRWRIFGEFVVAGTATYLLAGLLRRGPRPAGRS